MTATRTRYVKRWKLDRSRGIDRGLLDAAPIRDNLTALNAEGFALKFLARTAGVDFETVRLIVTGRTTMVRRAHAGRLQGLNRTALYAAAEPLDMVPMVGALRRLDALACLGWGQRDLAAEGLKPFRDRRATGARMKTWRYREVCAVYDRLWNVPGPSGHSRALAARHGWAPPLAWDDDTIDDPAARPVGTVGARQTARERLIEDLTELAENGGTIASVAARLGKDRRTLERALQRAGRTDLWLRLRQNAAGVRIGDEGVSA